MKRVTENKALLSLDLLVRRLADVDRRLRLRDFCYKRDYAGRGKILCAKSWWLNGAKRPKALPKSFFQKPKS